PLQEAEEVDLEPQADTDGVRDRAKRLAVDVNVADVVERGDGKRLETHEVVGHVEIDIPLDRNPHFDTAEPHTAPLALKHVEPAEPHVPTHGEQAGVLGHPDPASGPEPDPAVRHPSPP